VTRPGAAPSSSRVARFGAEMGNSVLGWSTGCRVARFGAEMGNSVLGWSTGCRVARIGAEMGESGVCRWRVTWCLPGAGRGAGASVARTGRRPRAR
jgi:hypothetical protein